MAGPDELLLQCLGALRVEAQSIYVTADFIPSINQRTIRPGRTNLHDLGLIRSFVHHVAGTQDSCSELVPELGDFPYRSSTSDQRAEDLLVSLLETFGGHDLTLASEERYGAHLAKIETRRITQADLLLGGPVPERAVDDGFVADTE